MNVDRKEPGMFKNVTKRDGGTRGKGREGKNPIKAVNRRENRVEERGEHKCRDNIGERKTKMSNSIKPDLT